MLYLEFKILKKTISYVVDGIKFLQEIKKNNVFKKIANKCDNNKIIRVS